MGVHNRDNKLEITTEPKTIHFDLSKDFDNNWKNKTDFIIKHNELSAVHTITNEIVIIVQI